LLLYEFFFFLIGFFFSLTEVCIRRLFAEDGLKIKCSNGTTYNCLVVVTPILISTFKKFLTNSIHRSNDTLGLSNISYF
ncbi:hypothetical protein BY996DRAFT_6989850, partial [Phakopsora pachyrhizi]